MLNYEFRDQSQVLIVGFRFSFAIKPIQIKSLWLSCQKLSCMRAMRC